MGHSVTFLFFPLCSWKSMILKVGATSQSSTWVDMLHPHTPECYGRPYTLLKSLEICEFSRVFLTLKFERLLGHP